MKNPRLAAQLSLGGSCALEGVALFLLGQATACALTHRLELAMWLALAGTTCAGLGYWWLVRAMDGPAKRYAAVLVQEETAPLEAELARTRVLKRWAAQLRADLRLACHLLEHERQRSPHPEGVDRLLENLRQLAAEEAEIEGLINAGATPRDPLLRRPS